MFGATLAAAAKFQQAHWTGNAWLPQQQVLESMVRFRTATGARRYLSSIPAQPTAPARCAEFLVGSDVFSLSIGVTASGAPTTAEFNALVAKALQRAG
jgi:hypothetical protein